MRGVRDLSIWTLGVGVLLIISGTLLASPAARAAAPNPGVTIARLKYGGGGDWYSNPTSLPNLAQAVEARTSIPIAQHMEARVGVLDEELFDYPILYMNGHGRISMTDTEAERLRRYLTGGGFLWADDNYGMDESFRALMKRVFPGRTLAELPFDHPIYHSFYDFPQGPPKIHEHDKNPPQGLGLFDRGRLVVFYTYESDIGDGLEDEGIHDDPPEKREEAMRMAVNVIVYAVTGEASPRPLSSATLPSESRGSQR